MTVIVTPAVAAIPGGAPGGPAAAVEEVMRNTTPYKTAQLGMMWRIGRRITHTRMTGGDWASHVDFDPRTHHSLPEWMNVWPDRAEEETLR